MSVLRIRDRGMSRRRMEKDVPARERLSSLPRIWMGWLRSQQVRRTESGIVPMSHFQIIQGDSLSILRTLPAESVHCCVTSPPYWGLRDYGVSGQLGLEKTPEEYTARMVEVFAEVRRVLRADGTLWLNLGDSYAGSWGARGRGEGTNAARPDLELKHGTDAPNRKIEGLKPKDLVGIPWMVAKALQSPRYTGRISRERDRVWMAAILDGEGTICGFTHERKEHTESHHSIRTGVHAFVTNSSMAMLAECQRIWPASQSRHMKPTEGHLGDLPTDRWIIQGIDNKSQFIREIYPYLIVKRRQAIAAYTLLEMMADAKHLGHTPERRDVWEKRRRLVEVMSDLNHQRPVDLPSWCIEPPVCFESGWYLRSDIIWAKPNPMPESVTDRPTKAHEYLFLLTKSEQYFYDHEAIKEPASDTGRVNGRDGREEDPQARPPGSSPRTLKRLDYSQVGRNKRTVWPIATEPYGEAHFAVMPTALVEPCVMAGCPEGGTVQDPFAGSGTVGVVALRHARNFIGCELNPEYVEMARRRISEDMPMFNEEFASVASTSDAGR